MCLLDPLELFYHACKRGFLGAPSNFEFGGFLCVFLGFFWCRLEIGLRRNSLECFLDPFGLEASE